MSLPAIGANTESDSVAVEHSSMSPFEASLQDFMRCYSQIQESRSEAILKERVHSLEKNFDTQRVGNELIRNTFTTMDPYAETRTRQCDFKIERRLRS